MEKHGFGIEKSMFWTFNIFQETRWKTNDDMTLVFTLKIVNWIRMVGSDWVFSDLDINFEWKTCIKMNNFIIQNVLRNRRHRKTYENQTKT